MALTVDHHQPNQNYKHFCKICKKGFLCGRALGGHMRAHGIGDDSGNVDEDDGASDWEDNKLGGSTTSSPSSNKRMYALRTNPNRLRNCRICENCGKEFLSWKSFLEHGKCSSSDDVDESIVSSPGGSDYEDAVAERSTSGGWLKRKRSFRAEVEHYSTNNNSSSCPSTEEEDLANCLMMLSNAPTDPSVLTDHLELEPCTSGLATKNNHLHNLNPPINFINVAPITAMAPWAAAAAPPIHDKAKGMASSNTNSKGLFECKACKKVFNSHQALGGHRASHKKVKGCFAARLEHDHHQDGGSSLVVDYEPMVFNDELLHPPKSTPNSSANIFPSKKKAKVHECSICHRVFPSGQALGGHKRCHWITSNSPDTSTFTRYQQQIHHQYPIDIQPNELRSSTSIFNSQTQKALDLNLPAPNNIVDDPLGLKRSDSMNLLSLKVSTEFFLQSLGGSVNMKENQRLVHNIQPCIHRNQNNKDQPNNNNNNKPQDSSSQNNIDDEVDSKVKLAKLSELKHINVSDNGSTTPWLQVGIGSSDGIGT